MFQQITYIFLFLAGWYMIYLAFNDQLVNIDMNRNNSYTIRGEQYAVFGPNLSQDKILNCTLSALHDSNCIDILIYTKYSNYYDKGQTEGI